MSLKDFEFIKELGKGSFGSVSLVRRRADGILYGLKKVNIGSMGNKEKENALNEVRLLASISSKQIIGYKEAFFDDSSQSLNIIMEYADDGDLDKKIKQKISSNTIFKEDEVWFFSIQMLKGLRALHDMSIMHRDLKSANIFLTKNGQVKIGDLNVGKLIKDNKLAITQTGTPYYASPEVWADIPYNLKADLWSFGCIVYEMCCLKTPFRAKNLPELFETVTKGDYNPIPNYYSNNLSDFINRLLQVNPQNRLDCKQAFDLDYVKDKIKYFQNKLKKDQINDNHHDEDKHEFVSTIKVPLNLNDINNVLPRTKYDSDHKSKTPPSESKADYKPIIKQKIEELGSTPKKNNSINLSQDAMKLKKTNSTSTMGSGKIRKESNPIQPTQDLLINKNIKVDLKAVNACINNRVSTGVNQQALGLGIKKISVSNINKPSVIPSSQQQGAKYSINSACKMKTSSNKHNLSNNSSNI